MKQYVIDELRPADHEKIRACLDELFGPSGMDGLYWIALDQDILSDIQAEHTDCQPFFFAVELKPEGLCCELLIRTKSRVRCSCMSYAEETQRNWVIDRIDALLEKIGITT